MALLPDRLTNQMRDILKDPDFELQIDGIVDEVVDALVEATLPYDELLDEAWRLIANAGGGDWKRETTEWQMAAHRFGVKAGYRQEHP